MKLLDYDYQVTPSLSAEQEATARAVAHKLKGWMKDAKIEIKMVLNKPAVEAIDLSFIVPQKKDPSSPITIQRTKIRTAANSTQVVSLMPILE